MTSEKQDAKWRMSTQKLCWLDGTHLPARGRWFANSCLPIAETFMHRELWTFGAVPGTPQILLKLVLSKICHPWAEQSQSSDDKDG